MRPAVCSSYSSRFSTSPDCFGRRVVGFNLLGELGNLLCRPGREKRRARLRTQLGNRLHRKAAISFDEQAERRLAVAVGELAEDLREVGRMLLLQQIQQVSGRTDAQQSLD